MKEIVVEEILNYSRKIELESYSFYKECAFMMKDEEVKALAEGLAEEEIDHYNRLNKLLDGIAVGEEELKKRIKIEKIHYETLVVTRTVPAEPTPLQFLEIALEREEETKDVYTGLAIITDLTGEVVLVFEQLMNQEEGHILRIRNLMKGY